MSVLHFFLKRFHAGDPVAKVADIDNMNRIANILEGIQGMGCHIEKPTNAEGKDWTIVVDGYTSDIPPPPGFPTLGLPSGGYKYQVLQKASDDDGDVIWDWVRVSVPSV